MVDLVLATYGSISGDELSALTHIEQPWLDARGDLPPDAPCSEPISTADDAQGLIDELVYGLIEKSDGGTLGDCFPNGNPPLDHEDGMVYGACRELAREDPLAQVYCITRDRGFLAAETSGSLSGHTRVFAPSEFVALTRAARSRLSIKHIARP